MKPNQIAQLDLKRRPIIAINKRIKKTNNIVVPEIKNEAVNDAIKNTNLLMCISDEDKRSYYIEEPYNNNWSSRLDSKYQLYLPRKEQLAQEFKKVINNE